MDRDIVTIPTNASVSAAVEKMVSNDIWSLVVEKNGLPMGVVTDRDVLRRAIQKGLSLKDTKVESIMSSPLITVDADEAIGAALVKMAERKVRRLYIIEKGKVIGRVTQTEGFQNLLDTIVSISSVA
jgi:predicted transcriptional regulator